MAKADAGTSYVVLWASKHIEWMKKLGELGKPLEMMYGSPHGSAPSLRRYGIEHGDHVFIVSLRKGTLGIVARVRVDQIISEMDYFRDHLRLPKKLLNMHLWDLSERLAKERPELGHRLPFGCVDEVALFSESIPLRLDVEVPSKVLASLRFRPKTGAERALPLDDGKLKHVTPIQGHFFRLAPLSAKALHRLVDRAAPPPA